MKHQNMVRFACDLADSASEVTLRYFRRLDQVDNKLGTALDAELKKGQFDPVTIADREAEKVMRSAIEKTYPSHGIVGEEYGNKIGDDPLTWVLDPIDGTRAFISGIPLWGTLIALSDNNEPCIGVMDQPFTGERFVSDGQVTTYIHNNAKTSVNSSHCTSLADAIMMSTAPDMFEADEYKVQQALGDQVKLLRYGADCYAYCMLASGHIDLVVEAGLGPYDIQALIPIVRSAGGIVTDWCGETAANGGQVIAAATPELHAQALSVLAPAARKSEIIL